MKICVGDWVWVNDAGGYYAPPAGCIGGIDFSPTAEQGAISSSRPGGLFFAPDSVATPDHAVLSQNADPREVSVTARMRDAFASHFGHRANGERLTDLIWDALISGADPQGEAGPKPLMPSAGRKLQLAIPGLRVVKQDKFTMGHSHLDKVVATWRRDYRNCFEACQRGDMPVNFHRRFLDATCEQFRTDDWRSLLPIDLRQHVAGRLPHSTTISESFNTSDGDTLGPDLSWTELTGDIDIVSNKAQSTTTGAEAVARADSDLSSANHYAQATVNLSQEASAADAHVICRKDSSTTRTFMAGSARADTNGVQLYKCVATTYTLLAVYVRTVAASTDYVLKILSNGSLHETWLDGTEYVSMTDTSVSSGTRGGIRGFMSAGNCKWDVFSATDQLNPAFPTIVNKSSVLCKL